MGWFSKKEPTTKIGRYIVRGGSWGLAFGALACVMVLGLVLEIHRAMTMHAVTAEVVAIEDACVLSYLNGKKKYSDLAESCEIAESMKAKSVDKLYEIEEFKIVTMSWPTQDNRIATLKLSTQESKPFSRRSVGDLVAVRVGEGKKPAVKKRMSLTTVAIFAGVITLIFWWIWPWKSEKTGGAGIYIREGGQNSGFFSRIREGLAGLAIKGAVLGFLGVLLGGFLWVSEIKANWSYTETTARLEQIETYCRLSYRNEEDKRKTSDRMTCERAETLALNDTGVDYTVKKKQTYHLSYDHPVAGETKIERSLLLGNEAVLGGTIPILFNPENAKRIQIVRQEKSFHAGKFLFWSALTVVNISASLAYFLGAYIVWPGQGRATAKPTRSKRPSRNNKKSPTSHGLQQVRSRRRPKAEV